MPTRYLKPGICDSDSIEKSSALAECLYYRLLVNVDDFGRLDARPAVVRSKCFPLKDTISNKKTEELLKELEACGLIILYEIEGCVYLQFTKWDNIARSKSSKCPEFVSDQYTSVCNPRTVLPVTVTVTETVTETVTVKPKQSPAIAEQFILPGWIDRPTWELWLKTRKGKKMILDQMKNQIDKLEKWRDEGLDYAQALEDAAGSGWQGLFKPSPGRGKAMKPEKFSDKNYGTEITLL